MSKELEAKIATSKSWNIGNLITNHTKDGTPYRSISIPKEVRIFFGDTELEVPRNKKGVGKINLFKKTEKHPNLVKAEEQFNFKVTHDISVKLKKD